ncbi:hypothetical protein ACFPES_29155 [Paenibacillus sp. GCM10023248]|nr:hypothetical protein [Paenibacillus sp. MAHUQ-63]
MAEEELSERDSAARGRAEEELSEGDSAAARGKVLKEELSERDSAARGSAEEEELSEGDSAARCGDQVYGGRYGTNVYGTLNQRTRQSHVRGRRDRRVALSWSLD